MKKAMAILWPSLIFGGIGTVLFFSILDPVDLRFVGPLEFGRKAGYTVGFFFFWALAAALPVVALHVKKEHRERARQKTARWFA